jgi:ankyrin repeat protein
LSTFKTGVVWSDPFNIDIVKEANNLLLVDKEDINQIGYNYMTPLHAAATVGNLDMAAFLCERDADTSI